MMFRQLSSRVTRVTKPVVQLTRGVHVESKISALGLKMPPPAVPKGFVNFTVVNNVAYLSGHLPQPAEGPIVIGRENSVLCLLSVRSYTPRCLLHSPIQS